MTSKAILLSLALVLALTGCGQQVSGSPKTGQTLDRDGDYDNNGATENDADGI